MRYQLCDSQNIPDALNDRTVKKYIFVVVEQKLCTFDKSTDPKRHLEAKLLMRHEKLHLRPDTTNAPGFNKAVGTFIRNPMVDLTTLSRRLGYTSSTR